MDLIPLFFKEYDESNFTHSKLINNYSHQQINQPNKSLNAVQFTNSKENFILSSEYIGIFMKESNIWVWSWASNVSRSFTPLSSNLINYALSFEEDKINREDFSLIRSMLVNSRIKIQKTYNLELLLGMILHITKGIFIVPIEKKLKNQTVIYYLLITDINKKIINLKPKIYK